MDLKVKKVNALPVTLEANVMYLVGEGAELKIYVSNSTGAAAKRVNTTADILSLIANTPAGTGITLSENAW